MQVSSVLLGFVLALFHSGPAYEAFRLHERDLIPEGITFDSVGKKFYVSSVHKAKIVEIDAATGMVRDFIEQREYGFFGGVGITVDAKHRRLLAASSTTDQVQGFTSEEDGLSGLFIFSLDDGSLIEKHVLDNKEERHLLNDLVVADDGTVYVTDTLTASIYVLAPNGDELDIFLRAEAIAYPNGIARMDGGDLLVADDGGIALIRIADRSVRRIATSESMQTVGIDGLYLDRGYVIAVQNHKGLNRVARFELDDGLERVVGMEVLVDDHPQFDIPTTAVLVEDELFVIANSQLRSFDEKRQLLPLEQLKETVVLRITVE